MHLSQSCFLCCPCDSMAAWNRNTRKRNIWKVKALTATQPSGIRNSSQRNQEITNSTPSCSPLWLGSFSRSLDQNLELSVSPPATDLYHWDAPHPGVAIVALAENLQEPTKLSGSSLRFPYVSLQRACFKGFLKLLLLSIMLYDIEYIPNCYTDTLACHLDIFPLIYDFSLKKRIVQHCDYSSWTVLLGSWIKTSANSMNLHEFAENLTHLYYGKWFPTKSFHKPRHL